MVRAKAGTAAKSARETRAVQATPESLPKYVVRLGNGILTFKRRWPVEVTRRHPKVGQFFQRSLKTTDARAIAIVAASALMEYQQHVDRYLEPSADERVSQWLNCLTAEQKRKLMEGAQPYIPRQSLTIFPDGFPNEPVNDKDDGPNYVLPDHPSGNPFLSGELPTKVIDHTPETLVPLILRAIDETSDILARPVVTEGRRRTFSDGLPDQAVLARKLSNLISALRSLQFPDGVLPAAAIENMPARELTLSDALQFKTEGMEERYANQIKWSVRLFHGIVGEKPLTSLKTADLNTFEADLRKMPTSSRTRNEIIAGKLTVRAAIESADPSEPKLSLSAVAKHIDFVSSVSKIAFGRGLAGDKPDPFASFVKTRQKKVATRKHFLLAELEAIFGKIAEKWVGVQNDRVWITLIALFHALRREEVCQLMTADICEVDGIHYFNIATTTDDDDDEISTKRLKTESARRQVPIHQKLIDAGFIDHVNRSTGPRLFTSLTQDTDGRWGGNFGKRFAELRGDAGVEGHRTLNFHSFRHTAISKMREVQWPHAVQLAICGHSTGSGISASANDGYGAAASPSVTKPWIDKLEYSGAPAIERVLTALTPKAKG